MFWVFLPKKENGILFTHWSVSVKIISTYRGNDLEKRGTSIFEVADFSQSTGTEVSIRLQKKRYVFSVVWMFFPWAWHSGLVGPGNTVSLVSCVTECALETKNSIQAVC